ncbi:hypothetical protein K440DRAFT_656809 [Wilcoxina mikolae CBS 423.85]|nr:hypothetical protein K440DRAFT_656809 [Wilcoxina mikolae CBS 423.85]
MASEPSIFLLWRDCMNSFHELINSQSESGSSVVCAKLRDDLGRFRVWTENAGAHRRNRQSLDHRLREASKVKSMVLKLLKDLYDDLQSAIAEFSSGTTTDDDGESWPSDSSTSSLDDTSPSPEPEGPLEGSHNTGVDRILADISHVITCLYEFSIAIKNPVPRDRLEKCKSIDVSAYLFFDIQHVSNKFPGAEKYLVERLGKANTTRRQLLKYNERHHSKIAGYGDQAASRLLDLVAHEPRTTSHNDDDGNSARIKAPATIAGTMMTQTTVSVYIPRRPGQDLETVDACSDSDNSQTSFASSSNGKSGVLRVPPPPDPESAFDGKPFQCPYCYEIISVTGNQSWIRHKWFEHEVGVHRREWYCKTCNSEWQSQSAFRDHILDQHSAQVEESRLQTVIDRCEGPRESDQPCPLCGEAQTPKRLQRHLAGHMQQLSLFVSGPRGTNDSEEMASEGAQFHGSEETSEALDQPQVPSIRFIPYQDPHDHSRKPLHFEPIQMSLHNKERIRIGGKLFASSIPKSDIKFDTGAVAAFQCGIWCVDGQWDVRCCHNAYPMYLNDIPVSDAFGPKTYQLNSGDILQLGDGSRKYGDHNCVMIKVELNPGDTNSNIDDRLEFDSNPSRQSDEGNWDQFPHDVADSSPSPPDPLSMNPPPPAVSGSSVSDDTSPPLQNFDQRKAASVTEAPDPPFTADEEEAFSKFLADEGRYTQEQWDQLSAQGRWKEAEELLVQVMETRKRVMETRKRVLGQEHPDTLTSMNNLASTYTNQGRWAEAEIHLIQVVNTCRTTLGEDHPHTVRFHRNLATLREATRPLSVQSRDRLLQLAMARSLENGNTDEDNETGQDNETNEDNETDEEWLSRVLAMSMEENEEQEISCFKSKYSPEGAVARSEEEK